MLRKWFLFMILSIIFSLVLAGCGTTPPQKVKVAVSLPGHATGQSMLKAVELALDEAGGKAGDITVELLVFETGDSERKYRPSPKLEGEAVEKTIADPDVVAYLGPVTISQARISTAKLNEASIVQITPTAIWPGLTKPGYAAGEPAIFYPSGQRHLFRLTASSEAQGRAAARWCQQLNFKTVYIVDAGGEYSESLAGIFRVFAQDFDLEIIGHESFDVTSATPEQIVQVAAGAVEAQPDVIFFGGAALQGDEFTGSVRALDSDIPMIGIGAFVMAPLIKNVGAEQAEGIYGVTSAPLSEFETATDFVAGYKAAYGQDPVRRAGNAYEAMKVLLYAIEHAQEPTREGVLKAVENLGEFSGIFGQWHFDQYGDISPTRVGGFQIQGGEWKFVQFME